MAKKQQPNLSPRIQNRRARRDYDIIDSFEVGLSLKGSEVKSIRHSQIELSEGFARVESDRMELILYNVEIAPYTQAYGDNGHDPRRSRKLLIRKAQIRKLDALTSDRGITLVPLTVYFVRGLAKLELGVGKGRKQHDKRQNIKEQESRREIQRAMTRKRL